MKKIIYILILSVIVTELCAQITTNAVCDETMEIPYTFSYSGFILYEDFGQVNTSSTQLRIDITKNDPQGDVLFSELHTVPFDKSGFFNVSIGSIETIAFTDFVLQLSESALEDYYIVVYLRDASFNFNQIGSKEIQTVPYAMVANSIGGLGPRGIKGETSTVVGPVGLPGPNGPDGPTSAPGAPGATGPTGVNGFGIMMMTNIPPTDEDIFLYVDDGTNTTDGKPHLRTKVDGTWIDL